MTDDFKTELKKKTKDELIDMIAQIGERGAQDAKRVVGLQEELRRSHKLFDLVADMLVEERMGKR